MNLKIKTLITFEKSLKHLSKKYKSIKKDYKNLLLILSTDNVNAVDLGDNFYKIRLKNSSTNKGKSSGFRVVYFYKTDKNTIYLLDMYIKSEVENISKEQLKELVHQYKL